MRIHISFLFILLSLHLLASHNRAGDLTFIRTGEFTIQATVTTYTDFAVAPADRDSLYVCWGDGNCEWVVRNNGIDADGDGIPEGEIVNSNLKYNTYIASHTYLEYGDYKMYMEDANRNAGILNINAPFSAVVAFYLTNEFSLLEEYDNSPVFLESPIDDGFVGSPFYHVPNAYDVDGDSIAYRMVTPIGDDGAPVPDYQLLTDFPVGGSTLSFDEASGIMIWENPQLAGVYVVAIEVLSYRNGIQIGSMMRDMSITISNMENELPDILMTQFVTNDYKVVEVGEEVQFLIVAEDLENTNGLTLTVTSELFGPNFSEPPVFTIFFQNGVATESNFFWDVKAEHLRDQPYLVVFKVVDDFGLANFAVVRFKVVDELTDVPKVVVEEPINLYPNPCGDYLYLDSNAFVGQEYEVCNLVGNKVYGGRISGNGAINVVGIRNGIYIVKFENGRFGKFIKN